MKIDNWISKYAVSRDQSFFLACWFNQVHTHSLDSYRVRTMNPENSLRELARIFDFGTEDEIEMVRDEVVGLLQADQVLNAEKFASLREQLLEILRKKDFVKNKGHHSMMRYLIREFSPLIEEHYVDTALEYLAAILTNGIDSTIPEQERFRKIEQCTSHLLSMLLDRDASLESLFALYSQILVPRKSKGAYVFDKKLGLLRRILLTKETNYLIVLAIENVSRQQDFPSEIAGLKFLKDSPCSPHAYASASSYLTPAPRKLFAVQEIVAQDPRAAGSKAFEKLNDILNLVRFEYEREHVATPDMFAFTDDRDPAVARIFNLPKVVPNPSLALDGAALAAFVQSVNELVTAERFQIESRDRVHSAFRLYRTGLDTPILANKLMNWWTAVEFLVRGTTGSGSIGKSVETLLAPVLCRTYVAKLLVAIRNALLDEGVSIKDPVTSLDISLRGMTPEQIYVLFKRADIQAEILNAIAINPYIHYHVSKFFDGLNDLSKLRQLVRSHEQRVRWHLQRLYRARCDTVHSARTTVSNALLCACLEFYIKTTLMSLLRALRIHPTLASAKEFFERESFSYERMMSQLDGKQDSSLMSCLLEYN